MVIRLFNKQIDIGWTCYSQSASEGRWREAIQDRPKKISAPKEVQGDIRYCPAFNNFYKNVYVIRCPFDIHLAAVDGKIVYVPTTNLTAPEHSIISIVDEDAEDAVSVQIFANNTFVSDTPYTVVETLPPLLHGAREEIRYLNGRFDCHAWQRPVQFGFQIPRKTIDQMTLDDGLVFAKDEVIMYVRINTPNDETTKLHTMSFEDVQVMSDYTYRNISVPVNIRKLNFKNIIDRVRYRRPKKFLRNKNYDTE
jgi:hypothetical protein